MAKSLLAPDAQPVGDEAGRAPGRVSQVGRDVMGPARPVVDAEGRSPGRVHPPEDERCATGTPERPDDGSPVRAAGVLVPEMGRSVARSVGSANGLRPAPAPGCPVARLRAGGKRGALPSRNRRNTGNSM
eukprot:4586567-Alexandrium_andersonii.AAC.1